MNLTINSIVCLLMIFVLSMFSILLLHIGRHTKSNIYLAVYFISQIIGILCFLSAPSGNVLFIFAQSVCYLWGALFYMFILSLFNSDFKLKYKSLLHTIPFFLVFAVLELHWNNCFANSSWLSRHLYNALNILFGILVLGYSAGIIYKYFLYSKLKKIHISSVWVKAAVFGYSVSSLIVQFVNIQANDTLRFVIGDTTFLIYFSILFYVAIVNKTITDKNEVVEKYRNSNLKNHVLIGIMEQIETYMQTTKAYINPELCLRNLSEALTIQEKYISETINKLKNQNFSEFINSYRISYAKDLLRNPENRDKTILYVLYEAGFNSKTTFNTCFKKVVGCTPVEYKKKYVLSNVTDDVSV